MIVVIILVISRIRWVTRDVTKLKRYYKFFDKIVSKFVWSELLEREIEINFNDEMMKIQKKKKKDPFYDIKFSALNNKRKKDLQAFQPFKQKQKRQKCKRTIKDYMKRTTKLKQWLISITNKQSAENLLLFKKIRQFNEAFYEEKNVDVQQRSLYSSVVYDIINVLLPWRRQNDWKHLWIQTVHPCFSFLFATLTLS